jgi:hypothetical protein
MYDFHQICDQEQGRISRVQVTLRPSELAGNRHDKAQEISGKENFQAIT